MGGGRGAGESYAAGASEAECWEGAGKSRPGGGDLPCTSILRD